MGYKRRLFENLPIYARLADEAHGLVALLCDRGIQPQFDDFQRILENQENFYDPDHPASSTHLDWLGQFVALGAIQEHFLGIGINPNWTVAQKRKIIWRAWKYWQAKGTEWGVREAFALWLQWEAAHNKERLLINYPFGDRPTDTPPQWWGWGEGYAGEGAYDTHLLERYPERQHFGSGDYPGIRHRPFYFTLQQPRWKWDYAEIWGENWLNYIDPPTYENKWSCLGPKNVWFHSYLDEFEWDRVFPDVFELLDEALAVTIKPTVFGWVQLLRQIQPVKLIESDRSTPFRKIVEFEVDGVQYGVTSSESPGTKQKQTSLSNTPSTPIDVWAWGGTLWYHPVTDPYTTVEQISEKIWFGNWRPRWWNGMWWGKGQEYDVLLFVPEIEVDVVLDLEGLNLSAWEEPPGAAIDFNEIQSLFIESGELWYAPWQEHTLIRNSETKHPGSACLQGIPLEIYQGELPEVDLGEDWRSLSNQLLTDQVFEEIDGWFSASSFDEDEADVEIDLPHQEWDEALVLDTTTIESGFNLANVTQIVAELENWNPGRVGIEWYEAEVTDTNVFESGFYQGDIDQEQGFMLAPPIQIATHFQINDAGYPWIMDREGEVSLIGELSTVPELEVPLIDLDGIAPINATRGYLCNAFGGWSTGEISNYRERKEADNSQKYGLFDIYPILGMASDAQNWNLLIETDEELYILKPVTIFWYRGSNKQVDRSTAFSFEQGFTNLCLEFVFQTKKDTQIRSATLWLLENRIQHQTFYYQLNAPEKANIGFDFGIPFRLPSGFDTPDDELAVEQLLPLLKEQLLKLEEQVVPTPQLPAPIPPVVQGELLSPTPAVQSLRDVLVNFSDRLSRLERLLVENRSGDLHFSYQIQSPVTEIQIQHNFGQFNKQPAITFNCEGADTDPDIYRLDANTVLIIFTQPTVGWVYFN